MAPLPPSARIVRDRGDRGRVLHYTRDDGHQVYAKVYPTAAESHRCVEVLTALRDVGFGGDAPHRVPAVLEHRVEERVVVLGAAPGISLAALVRAGPERWRTGVRSAARWLGALHATPTSVCRSTDVARPPLVRLQARREALVAARPELTAETRELLESLAGRAPRHPHAVDRTTHGRFHPEHVFLDLDADVVTGIDLDRATPADPVRDLGEFVHRLRASVARTSGAAARTTGDELTAEFVAQYRRSSPGADLGSLVYHWSFAILWHLFGSMAKHRSQVSLDRHRTEFAAVPRLVTELT